MIIPYSTDAPVYHWPIATGGIIAANVFAFVVLVSLPPGPQEFVVDWTVLTYGNFNPLTWITSNYVHAHIFHLLGNMLSLWVFGLIVEGKIGAWKFLLIYHAIGIVQCAAEQTLTIFFTEGGSLGASAIIYGLMAISLVWAPSNNIQCQSLGGFYSNFEVSVYFFVGLSLFLEFAAAIMNIAFSQSLLAALTSEVLHLMGAGLGAFVGIFMLKYKMVDCEGWDAFSVYAGKHTRSREEIAEEYMKSAEGQQRSQELRATAAEQVRKYVAVDETQAAWAAYKRGLNQFPGFQLAENDLLGLIAALRKAAMWDECITLMVTFLRQYPNRDSSVRLALAQLLIEKKQRGRQAFYVLQKIDKAKLDPRQVPLLEKFAAQSRAMAEDDPYEVAAEDW